MAAGLGEGQIAEFVEDDEVEAGSRARQCNRLLSMPDRAGKARVHGAQRLTQKLIAAQSATEGRSPCLIRIGARRYVIRPRSCLSS
jgi:hypothetical protein